MAKICAQLMSNGIFISSGELMVIFDGRKPSSLTIPDLIKSKTEKSLNEQDSGRDSRYGGQKQDMVQTTTDCYILCLRACKCMRHVAVINSRKQLAVVELQQDGNSDNTESKAKIIFSTELQRNALCLAFLKDCKRVLVADKSGDVVAYDIPSGDRRLLLGHLAIILDILISEDNKYVISCDRDEKIKVTSYPNTYNIQSFCLGHTEYVIGIGFIPEDTDILYSASGDGTIRLWKYKDGTCLHIIDLRDHRPSELIALASGKVKPDVSKFHQLTTSGDNPIPVKKVTISKDGVIAVLFHEWSVILLIKVIICDNVTHKIVIKRLQNLSLLSEPWDICFDYNGNLLVLNPCIGNTTPIAIYSLNDDMYNLMEESSLLTDADSIWPQLKVSSDVPSVIPTLFKQSFDNVANYYVTKAKRTNSRSASTDVNQEIKRKKT